MNTILQAHPNVKVVLGSSGVIGGVFAAYDAKGMGQAKDVYLSSIAGADDALAQIRSGSAYKATFNQASSLFAYAAGQFAADWMEGKSIPQGLTSPGGMTEISSPEVVDEWKADMDDTATTWKTKRDKYCAFYGNVRYEDRENYWKEVWMP
jgi:ribose transport system substrate-binding protein